MKLHTKLILVCVLFSATVGAVGYAGLAASRAIAANALMLDKLDELMAAYSGIKQAVYQGMAKQDPEWIREKQSDADEYLQLYIFGHETLKQYEEFRGLAPLHELKPLVETLYASATEVFQQQDPQADLESFELAAEEVEIFAEDTASLLRERINSLSNESLVSEKLMYGLGFLAVLLTLAISWFFSAFIYRPVHALTEAVHEFEQGKLDAQVAVKTDDELGTLAVAFNTMAQTIRDNTTRLKTAKDKAEQASQAKSKFLGVMSHELRTPLNAILGFGELAREEAEESGCDCILEDIKRIEHAGQHLLEIINSVLFLQSIDLNDTALDIAPFHVKDICDELQITLASLLEKQGNKLATQLPPGEQSFKGDACKIRILLKHLLDNANKFSKDSEITLAISLREDTERDWLDFAVQDQGIGIDKSEFTRIFEAFTQVDDAAARSFEGTGLGLTIAQKYAEILGGKIVVESEIGKGSCFTLSVPVNEKRGVAPHPLSQ